MEDSYVKDKYYMKDVSIKSKDQVNKEKNDLIKKNKELFAQSMNL